MGERAGGGHAHKKHATTGAAAHAKPKTARPRVTRGLTFSATEDHDNRPHAGAAAVMPSQPIGSVSEAASEFHSSRPEGPAIRPKELVFQRWMCRTANSDAAKFTACRKKCAVCIGAAARSQGRVRAKLQQVRAFDRSRCSGAPTDGEEKPALQASLSPAGHIWTMVAGGIKAPQGELNATLGVHASSASGYGFLRLAPSQRPDAIHAGRVSPLIWVRCMMRREFGSKASRRCMVQRLSHSTRSPTRQPCSQATSGRAT
jgi:hypothetical protein